MNKELSPLSCPQQKNDTLYFLINEFFIGSKLSKLEIISQSKDKELSMLMEEFYKISNVYDNLKEAAEFEMQFNSNMNSSIQTSSKISTTTTKSMNSAKKKYMPFFNKNEDKFKLQTIRRQKEPKKVLLNYTAENEKIKKSNITPDNKLKTTGNKESHQRHYYSTAKMSMSRQMNSLTYGNQKGVKSIRFNYTKPTTQRISFKFEPKKKSSLLKTIQSVEIKQKSEIGHKVNKIGAFFSTGSNVNIIRKIYQFLPKQNCLINMNKITRRVFLLNKINELTNKISTLNEKPSNTSIKTDSNSNVTNSSVNNLDSILEIEILKHNEAKLREFLSHYE